MSAFKRMADNIRTSRFAILIVIVTAICFFISLGLAYEDYMSSYYGYSLFPTRKTNDFIIILAAALPQAGQVLFFYVFARSIDERRGANGIYLLIILLLFSFDLGTDVFYKANGQAVWVWLLAVVESILLFTIGSEVLLSISFGILLEIIPDAFTQIGLFFEHLMGGFKGSDKSDNQGPNNSRQLNNKR